MDVDQVNLYTNLMYQSYLFNSQHTYTTGLSLQFDDNNEWFAQHNNPTVNQGYSEIVPGVFFEYSYIPSEKFSLLMGVRNDYSTLHGNFMAPRIHAKYNLSQNATIRLSAGKGYRTPSMISENTQYLATAKTFNIPDSNIQEEAWNYGISMHKEFLIGKRNATITFEYFRTDFMNQLIVDLEQNSNMVYFYKLDGKSYANSIQFEVFYEPFNRFELNWGLRFNQIRSSINNELKEVPFQSNYKGLISAQYRTNLNKWQFDTTVQFKGSQRLPETYSLPENRSNEYINVIAQITKNYRYWSFYAGAENITNYTQSNAIIEPESPFSNNFDASRIWGPLYGRMIYVGIKYKLDKRS